MSSKLELSAIFTVIFTRNGLEQAHEPSFRAIQISHKSGKTTEEKHLHKTKINKHETVFDLEAFLVVEFDRYKLLMLI